MSTTTLSKGIKYWDDHDYYGDDDRETRRLLNAFAREDFANNPLTTTGLTYGYRQGVGFSGTFSIVAAGTVALVDDATNYVQRTAAGVVSVNQVGFSVGAIPMAVVTTVAGAITTIEDYRAADSLIASAVTSVFGRIGAVTAQAGDYAIADITGLVAALNAIAADIVALENDKLDKAGGTMTGPLVLDADPATDLEAATKQYVDAAVGGGGYTDEMAQDAVGAMVDDSTIEYVDATPLLRVKDAGITPAKQSPNAKTFQIVVTIGDGVNVISTGFAGDIPVKIDGTITDWDLFADAAGDIVIDSWKDTYANFPPTDADSMWGGSEPELAGVAKSQATGLSIAIAAGEVIRFNVDSAATVKQVTLSFSGIRT